MLGKQIHLTRHVDDLGRIVIPKEIVDEREWDGKRFDFTREKNSCIVTITDNPKGRRLDPLRRLVIPIDVRKRLNLISGVYIFMNFHENGFILTRYEG